MVALEPFFYDVNFQGKEDPKLDSGRGGYVV